MQTGPQDSSAVHQFVQNFYNWYTPRALADHMAWWDAIALRAQDLDARLVSTLRLDSIARVEPSRTREVINFDPFLHSQDPCPKYAVTKAQRVGPTYRVSVHPVCSNAESQHWQDKETVVVVESKSGKWKIMNILYEPGDLIGMVCADAMADIRPEKRPKACP